MKKLKPHAVDWAQIDRFLASADKKLASAHKNEHHTWQDGSGLRRS
jgi:hypothetical protein